MTIPSEFIQEVLSRTNIVEIINSRVTLKKRGSSYTACCPFHQEKTPSFHVNPRRQIYKCFGCGVYGDAIGFLMEYDHLTFLEALYDLAKKTGLEVPQDKTQEKPPSYQFIYQANQKVAAFYQQTLKQSPQALNYLQDRGINTETIEKYYLGYAPEKYFLSNLNINKNILIQSGLCNENGYERFRQRIIFPIRDRQGRVIAFGGRVIYKEHQPKYLNSPETEIFHKNKEIYGFYEARQSQKLTRFIVVEGYLDVLSLAQAGFTETVATLGTAINQAHIQKLLRITPEIIFCFDGDTAGLKAAWRALEESLTIMRDSHTICFLILENNEDPDSFVQKQGAQAFEEKLQTAQNFADFFFSYIKKQYNYQTLNGRAQLMEFSQPLLDKMQAPYLKAQMQEQLAKIAQLSIIKTEDKQKNNIKMTAMRLAILLLIYNPQLLQETTFSDYFYQLQAPGMEILLPLIEYIQQHPEINTAGLLQYFKNHNISPMINKLLQLANRPELQDEQHIDKNWQDCINNLTIQAIDAKTEALLKKANNLSLEEKQELNNLLFYKKNIK